MQVQLDFFQEFTEVELLQEQVRQLRESHEKIRKSLFAKHGELAKRYVELHNRLNILELNICRG